MTAGSPEQKKATARTSVRRRIMQEEAVLVLRRVSGESAKVP